MRPKRPHVLAAVGVLGTEADLFHCFEGQLRDVERQHAKAIERAVFERIDLVAGFLEVVRSERAGVDHEQAAGLEHLGVHLERGRVHRHEDVGASPGVWTSCEAK